jgi:hypothetical protein
MSDQFEVVKSRIESARLLETVQAQLQREATEGLPLDPGEVTKVVDQLEQVRRLLPAT